MINLHVLMFLYASFTTESHAFSLVHNPMTKKHASAFKLAPREAIVLLSRPVEHHCNFQRVLALALSSSTDKHRRDVWLLQNGTNTPEQETMANELKKANVFIAPQPDIPAGRGWNSFGAIDSGTTKPSFLVFALNHPEYDHFWFLEDDVFYTGKYGDLFDDVFELGSDEDGGTANLNENRRIERAVSRPGSGNHDRLKIKETIVEITSNIVSRIVSSIPKDNRWLRFAAFLLSTPNSTADVIGNFVVQDGGWPLWRDCVVQGEPCLTNEDLHVKLRWPLARFSKRYVNALAEALSSSTHGHHEAVAANFCVQSSWCSLAQLPRTTIYASGWGKFQNKAELSLKHLVEMAPPYRIQESHVYHPVKCEASDDTGEEALRYAQGLPEDSL